MVVVRRGQAAQNHLDGLPFRLPGVPPACHGHGLDLCEWISRPASLTDVQSKNERMEFDVSLSVYDITVPVMVHGLNVMDDYLDHAQALERTRGYEPGRILGERLASDMLSFGEQFSVSCNKVDAHMAKLMQHDPPAPRNIPMMYPALKGRLLETSGFLQNMQPDEI